MHHPSYLLHIFFQCSEPNVQAQPPAGAPSEAGRLHVELGEHFSLTSTSILVLCEITLHNKELSKSPAWYSEVFDHFRCQENRF